jgi:hypothetical protein
VPPVRKTHRREIIEQLLEHLADYEEQAGRSGLGGGTGLTPMLPAIYHHPSVRELRRCLDRLYDTPELPTASGTIAGRTVHAHLVAFHRSDWRTDRGSKVRRFDRERDRFEMVDRPPAEWTRKRVVSPWVILARVEQGIAFVDEAFEGDPFLPGELLEAA